MHRRVTRHTSLTLEIPTLRLLTLDRLEERSSHDFAGALPHSAEFTRVSALGRVFFDRDGAYLGGFAPIEGSELTVQFPTGLVFDASGDLILQDAGREDGTATGRILKIQLLPPLAP